MRNILTILFVILCSSCYRDNEQQLYPGTGSCDTTHVTYSATVVTLLQSNGCLGCHSGAAPSGNISLQGYTNVRTMAQNGKLYGVINHAAGFSPMPKGGSKINTCDISKIKVWIDAGNPNN